MSLEDERISPSRPMFSPASLAWRKAMHELLDDPLQTQFSDLERFDCKQPSSSTHDAVRRNISSSFYPRNSKRASRLIRPKICSSRTWSKVERFRLLRWSQCAPSTKTPPRRGPCIC